MKSKNLSSFVEIHGQAETARRAGLSQGAIWQMLRSNRQITVIENDESTITLEETKVIPRRASA